MRKKNRYQNLDDIKAHIVLRLAEGEVLAGICRSPDMPCSSTVHQWRADDADFARAFAKARDSGFDVIAESCLDIADEQAADAQQVARNKLRVWTRLQLLAKWSNRYSERSQVTLDAGESIMQSILAARARAEPPS